VLVNHPSVPPQLRGCRSASPRAKPEELVRSALRLGRNLLRRETSQRSDVRCCVYGVRRLAPLTAKGDRRKKRTIRLYHKGSGGNRRGRFAQAAGVLERHDAGEAHQVIHREDLPRIIRRLSEAVKDSADLSRVRLEDRQRVIPGIPFVNDHRQVQFDSEVELLLEDAGLFTLHGRVLDGSLDSGRRLVA